MTIRVCVFLLIITISSQHTYSASDRETNFLNATQACPDGPVVVLSKDREIVWAIGATCNDLLRCSAHCGHPHQKKIQDNCQTLLSELSNRLSWYDVIQTNDKSRIEKLANKKKELEKIIDQLYNENVLLKERLSATEQALADVETNYNVTQLSLAKTTAEPNQLQDQCNGLKEEVEIYEKVLVGIEISREALEFDLFKITAQYNTLQRQCDSLKAEVIGQRIFNTMLLQKCLTWDSHTANFRSYNKPAQQSPFVLFPVHSVTMRGTAEYSVLRNQAFFKK